MVKGLPCEYIGFKTAVQWGAYESFSCRWVNSFWKKGFT